MIPRNIINSCCFPMQFHYKETHKSENNINSQIKGQKTKKVKITSSQQQSYSEYKFLDHLRNMIWYVYYRGI